MFRLGGFIQTVADGLGELLRLKRFAQKADAFLQWKILADHLGTVTTHINHFQFGICLEKALSQFFPGHSIRHQEIGQQQTDLFAVFFPDFQRSDTGGCFQNAVAEAC